MKNTHPFPIPPFIKSPLKKMPGGLVRLKQVKTLCNKLGSLRFLWADQSLNITRVMIKLYGYAYRTGSVAKKIRLHFEEIHKTCHFSETFSHTYLDLLCEHFIFFINDPLTPEAQNYFLLLVRTLHFQLVEGFPPGLVANRYGDNYLHAGKLNINEVRDFKVLLIAIKASRPVSISLKPLYKKIDWAVSCYLSRAVDFDPSFDCKPFFQYLGGFGCIKKRGLTKTRYVSCLSPFLYADSSFHKVPSARRTAGSLSVDQFVPAELLGITFAYELRAYSSRKK